MGLMPAVRLADGRAQFGRNVRFCAMAHDVVTILLAIYFAIVLFVAVDEDFGISKRHERGR
jgi:hypothetical protein